MNNEFGHIQAISYTVYIIRNIQMGSFLKGNVSILYILFRLLSYQSATMKHQRTKTLWVKPDPVDWVKRALAGQSSLPQPQTAWKGTQFWCASSLVNF